jgi:hypothetical protein
MHQMMTEQAFVGGQNFDAARQGKFEINTDGSLAHFKIALIDEIDKGNPAALSALLSLLNERQVLAGNKVIQSQLETIFSTSNANVYQICQQFAENGLRSTASALLNRFTSIAFIPNWLSKVDQAALDANYLDDLDKLFNPESAQAEVTDKSLQLDWAALRELARYLLRPTEEFFSIARDFTDLLRTETIKQVELNNEDSQKYTQEEKLPYYPTAEYTERLRERIRDIILMSVLVDLLTSKLADNIDDLERALKSMKYHRFSVGPLSVWRSYLSLTTVTFGKAQLIFPTKNNKRAALDLDFGNFFCSKNDNGCKVTYKATDSQEQQNIEYIIQEQQRFKATFLKLMERHKAVSEESGIFAGLFDCYTDTTRLDNLQDIERILFAKGV